MAIKKSKYESLQVDLHISDVKKLLGVPDDYDLEDHTIDCGGKTFQAIFTRTFAIKPGRPKNGRKL